MDGAIIAGFRVRVHSGFPPAWNPVHEKSPRSPQPSFAGKNINSPEKSQFMLSPAELIRRDAPGAATLKGHRMRPHPKGPSNSQPSYSFAGIYPMLLFIIHGTP